MPSHISKLSDRQIALQYGPVAYLGRMIRNWLEPQKANRGEQTHVNTPEDDKLKLVYHHVKKVVESRGGKKIKGLQMTLNDQWVAFELALMATMRMGEMNTNSHKVTLKYEGDLFDSNYYILEVRTEKSDRVLSTASIYGLH